MASSDPASFAQRDLVIALFHRGDAEDADVFFGFLDTVCPPECVALCFAAEDAEDEERWPSLGALCGGGNWHSECSQAHLGNHQNRDDPTEDS